MAGGVSVGEGGEEMINSIKVNCVTTKKKQYFIHGIKIYVYFSF